MNQNQAIIIDDERPVREALSIMIEEYCPEIRLVGTAASAEEGRKLLDEQDVSIIFLDISMPREDGFAFLNTIDKENYRIIFVTAYEEYAIQALRASAIDYLLKPVNPLELIDAVHKAVRYKDLKRARRKENAVQIEAGHTHDDTAAPDGKRAVRITVAEKSGMKVLDIADIIFLEADDNRTVIHIRGSSSITANRTLGSFESLLTAREFFRIHKSAIINLNYLSSYISHEGNFVLLSDGTRLAIARRKLKDFRKTIKEFPNS